MGGEEGGREEGGRKLVDSSRSEGTWTVQRRSHHGATTGE